MNYITTIIDSQYMQVGGFGHVFYDVLSSYIIAHLFNLKFVYSNISTLGDDYCRTRGKKDSNTFSKISWDSFLQFSNNELTMKDIEHLKLNKVYINLVKPFHSIDLNILEEFINKHDNTLFILTNNNRVYLNEIYHLKRDKYEEIITKLKNKLLHLKKEKNNDILNIAIHIRRGDWDWQPLDYDINFIKLFQETIPKNKKYTINIYSIGTKKQLDEIKNTFEKLDENITFNFDTDVFDTFIDIYNADIVVGGHSNFPKIITMFTNNLFIYLPNKDGIVPALGVNNKWKLYHNGRSLEIFDEDYKIMTNIYCNMNKDLIISKIGLLF